MTDPEPKCSEIVTLIVHTEDPEYWPDYIRGELLHKIVCSDGFVFIYYVEDK